MKTLLPITLILDGDRPNEVGLEFDMVISHRDLTIINTPSSAEFELLHRYCISMVWSCITHWVGKPGIPGIMKVCIDRHSITFTLSKKRRLSLEMLLLCLTDAILAAYPEHKIVWDQSGLDDKAATIVKELEEFTGCNYNSFTGSSEGADIWEVRA